MKPAPGSHQTSGIGKRGESGKILGLFGGTHGRNFCDLYIALAPVCELCHNYWAKAREDGVKPFPG